MLHEVAGTNNIQNELPTGDSTVVLKISKSFVRHFGFYKNAIQHTIGVLVFVETRIWDRRSGVS